MNKVDEAVRILGITTGLNVPQAMILAGFSKKETTNETVRRMIRQSWLWRQRGRRRRRQQLTATTRMWEEDEDEDEDEEQ